MANKLEGRARRKLRIRKKVNGTSERPRLTVFRSNKQIYAQVVDDSQGSTIAHATSLSVDKAEVNKSQVAEKVGGAIAQALLGKGIKQVVFDRNGYIYHGRVKALAEGARKGGLEF